MEEYQYANAAAEEIEVKDDTKLIETLKLVFKVSKLLGLLYILTFFLLGAGVGVMLSKNI